jgi:hypothetical protein
MRLSIKRLERRHLRLSLRGLIVVVLVIGLALGHFVRRVRIQAEAVAAVRKLGGSVLYDWQFDGKQYRYEKGTGAALKTVPWWPGWLVDRLGDDYFGAVTEVYFRREVPDNGLTTPTPAQYDQVLGHVGNLDRLASLCFFDTGVSDAGLAHLERLASLQTLIIRGDNQISDAGITHLRGMRRLRNLVLDDCQITDAALISLKGLPTLESLSLIRTRVSDAGMVLLKDLTHLEHLWLDETNTSDAGLIPLVKSLTQLQSISLSRTSITNDLLESAGELKNLRALTTRDTQVTDEGLTHMKGLSKLHTLDLSGTRVSHAGLKRLKGLARLQYVGFGLWTKAGWDELLRIWPRLRYSL